jgi:hypothetical protein
LFHCICLFLYCLSTLVVELFKSAGVIWTDEACCRCGVESKSSR